MVCSFMGLEKHFWLCPVDVAERCCLTKKDGYRLVTVWLRISWGLKIRYLQGEIRLLACGWD
ncbi:MAG: hypothetical protein N2D54_03340 [Chloroflexota bacterium]